MMDDNKQNNDKNIDTSMSIDLQRRLQHLL
ncbi:hypothetical protein MGSAQ_000212, partial [marine sediment metagenome]